MSDNIEKKVLYTPAKKEVNERYLNQLEDIKIRVTKGYRQKIREYADSQGLSLNQLVIALINEDAKKNKYDLDIPTGMKEVKKAETE